MTTESGRTGAAHLTLNALRIVTGFLFAAHGAQKLFGVLGRDAPVELMSLMGLAGVLEFFGGLLVMVGLFTRPVAFVLAGEMAVAYFMVHAPRGFWPLMNRGEPAVLFCFIFLMLAANGGGALSLDGWLAARRRGKLAG
ncbi:MAG: DoxX family protein [Gemmatimonadetes bacterium]|nr:MAG: DoxX family protein [Gemmatimonadota bacterium]